VNTLEPRFKAKYVDASKKLVLSINWVDKTKFSIRSDEGLTLEKSAFESLYGGQFTLSTQWIKLNYPIKAK